MSTEFPELIKDSREEGLVLNPLRLVSFLYLPDETRHRPDDSFLQVRSLRGTVPFYDVHKYARCVHKLQRDVLAHKGRK